MLGRVVVFGVGGEVGFLFGTYGSSLIPLRMGGCEGGGGLYGTRGLGAEVLNGLGASGARVGALNGPVPGFLVGRWKGERLSETVTDLVDDTVSLRACVGRTVPVCESPGVPKIVREPMIVETNVRGGIVVVSTEVMVSGESRV